MVWAMQPVAVVCLVMVCLGLQSPSGLCQAGEAAKADEAQPAAPRTWSDESGAFHVEAEFIGLHEGKVELRNKDGEILSVPLKRLSAADQAWIKSRVAEKKPDKKTAREKNEELAAARQRAEPALPDDFAFLCLTHVTEAVDLHDTVMAKAASNVTCLIRTKGGAYLASGRDVVQGLRGEGMNVQTNVQNVMPGPVPVASFATWRAGDRTQQSDHIIWSPQSFACYRNNALLGIWDVKAASFRKARRGETPGRPLDLLSLVADPKK